MYLFGVKEFMLLVEFKMILQNVFLSNLQYTMWLWFMIRRYKT